VPDLVRHVVGYTGHTMARWEQIRGWATVAVVWLMTIAIGIGIYLYPVTRLLDNLGNSPG
jgi:hypothetical protein